ncbi:hypothetical protein GCM10010377_78080 [Streptomyces viridiviolaceus]|uniref:Uncharacterized protein n=1 Tax=Streptomyces viridiviolaceus TaxID=68282 RepID=A0ABW2EHK6_9ACTN|nr:hypothetical protein [Streptomyces viridiviolaceus]GHB76050.1 hypothetical protein GCM10010377_78080 [Streptomyces viridiviolaceus]
MDKRHVVGYAVTGVAGLALGAVLGAASGTQASPKPSPAVTHTVTAPSPTPTPTPSERPVGAPASRGEWTPQEWADAFKAFTAKRGTAQQRAAVGHVVKVKGLDGNDTDWEAADDVKIFTDFEGEDYDYTAQAELILDALTDWQESREGDLRVEVLNANGSTQGSDFM